MAIEMTKTRVSTRQVWPWISYLLDIGDNRWVFAHPEFWKRKGLQADCYMDANSVDNSTESAQAKEHFYDFVADSIIWPNASETVDDILRMAKAGLRERERIEAGVQEMF